jgi:putative hydrolase of the HAD superfamily
MEVRAVLWDFGGVLTTSPFDSFATYEVTNGLPAGFIRQLNATNSDTNAWAGLERGHLDIDAFAANFEAEAAGAGAKLDGRAVLEMLRGELRPAMVEAARRCHERLKTGLLTNNFVSVDDAVGYGPVLSYFDVIVESSKARTRKPDPDFYRMACEQLEIDPTEAVFLDDLGINLKPARQMGMRTVKVTDPDAAIAELETIVGFRLTP